MAAADCKTCGGDGVVDVDCYTRGAGHHTVTKPCPTCYGGDREQLQLSGEGFEDTWQQRLERSLKSAVRR